MYGNTSCNSSLNVLIVNSSIQFFLMSSGTSSNVDSWKFSNVSLYDGSKASRVGIRVSDDNKKERFYKTTNEVIKG